MFSITNFSLKLHSANQLLSDFTYLSDRFTLNIIKKIKSISLIFCLYFTSLTIIDILHTNTQTKSKRNKCENDTWNIHTYFTYVCLCMLAFHFLYFVFARIFLVFNKRDWYNKSAPFRIQYKYLTHINLYFWHLNLTRS